MTGMTRADRCPGVLRPHLAADGALIRLRLPGGRTTTATLAELSSLAGRFGAPELQLTSRGSLQMRGLPDPLPADLEAAIRRLELLPSATHDRVRNIVASPLSGLVGGACDVRPVVHRLDAALQADPDLQALPGRFLFALDDGRRDVITLPFDLGYLAETSDLGVLLIGGPTRGLRLPLSAVVPTLIWLARRFLVVRGEVWHVRDLPDWVEEVSDPLTPLPAPAGIPGVGAAGGAASVQVPLGLLTPDQVATVAAVADEVVVTPWRGLVLPGAARRLDDLAAAGFVTTSGSDWSLISACIGAPGCAHSHGSTRDRAIALLTAGLHERTHVSGCDRRCGAPAGPHQDLVLA
jgi:precorrin-3B synthase